MKFRLIFIILTLSVVSSLLIFSFVSNRNQLDTISYDSPQWHLPEGAIARIGKGTISKIKYSPDGTLLAGISTIGVWLYDVQTGEARSLLAGHSGTINNITFSEDGKLLASASDDGSIRVWEVATGEHERTFIGDKFGFDNVLFSSDGKTLTGAGFVEINLWDLETNTHKKTFQEQYYAMGGYSIFSTDGKRFASPRGGKTIILWDVATGKEMQTLTGFNKRVTSMSFSPDGQTLASVGYGAGIHRWDVATGKYMKIPTEQKIRIYSLTFSPDGKTLVGDGDGTIYLWDIDTGGKRKKHSKDISYLQQELRSVLMERHSQV